MTRKAFDLLGDINRHPIEGSMLKNQADRTLIWGYTLDRDSWHVYLKDGQIYTVTYKYGAEPTMVCVTDDSGYIPSKRAYPEACDFEFACLLKARGINIPFTGFQDDRASRKYYGEVLEEHKQKRT